MLILTRRAGETLMIGENITVTVCAINGNQVKLGLTAPPEVKILREELVPHQGWAEGGPFIFGKRG